MHLRNDDTFGPVDDESPVRRHQRHVAHVDVLFLDVANGSCLRFLVNVPYNKPKRHFERGSVGHAALLAFLDIILWFLKFVVDIFQSATFGEIFNRENRHEDFLQTRISPVCLCDFALKECLVGGFLDLD